VIALLDKGYRADAALYIHPAESGVGMQEIKAIASGLLTFRIRVRGRSPDTTEPGKTAFAHLGINPINKAVLLLQALYDLDENRGRRVFHPTLNKKIGRSTNLLTGYIKSGEPGRETQMPDECIIGVSLRSLQLYINRIQVRSMAATASARIRMDLRHSGGRSTGDITSLPDRKPDYPGSNR